jgi:16S rRNA (guanine(966)-N(2))-methyltransferase RsmD
MRIIAGKWRSRMLAAPSGLDTRPTSDRLRETLFNVLAPRIEEARFLDLYAGSGAVGLEALSRGARTAVFVERGQAALKALRANLAKLEVSAGMQVAAQSVGAFLRRPEVAEPFDLVFLDPPYDADQEYETALGLLGGASSGLLASGAWVIAEHRKKDNLAEEYGGLKRVRLLKQGDAGLSFFQNTAELASQQCGWSGFPGALEGRSMKRFAVWMVLALGGLVAAAQGNWGIGPFTRPAEGNPVVAPDKASSFTDPILKASAHWEALNTFNPAAVERGGKVYVLYRAEDDSGLMTIGGHTSRLGLAVSEDGVHFTRRPAPVFYPAEDAERAREWPGGVEDPRLVESEDGTYVLTYTQWNRETYSVGIATSPDLEHWTKHGPAFFSCLGGKYRDLKYKSAGIVTRLDAAKGRLVAAKINGKYWMYWGEGAVHLAASEDLVHWTPVEDAAGKPIELLTPRAGHFDSSFPEVGPPPVLTDAGIVVLYNGKNALTGGDPALGPNAYAAGEALFAATDPAKLLAQRDQPALKPELAYEKTGQYAAGTTFAEGLVFFHGQWFLYYGCADSRVAVAAAPGPAATAESKKASAPELVILDTDIGDDIDDAFALGLILESPELKLLGVTTAFGDTELRARLVERYLNAAGKTEIPVAVGVATKAKNIFTQAPYARQLGILDICSRRRASFSQIPIPKRELERYNACEKARQDAVGFLLRSAAEHPGQITLIAIGPLFNVQAAIERDPEGFKKLKRVVLMGGSIARGYDGEHGERRPAEPEWNILCDPKGLKALLGAGVPVFMMPLDSTQVKLPVQNQEKIFAHGSAVTDQIALLYGHWTVGNGTPAATPTLYDPVTVAYTIRPELCPASPMHVEVDAKGMTWTTALGAPNAQVCLVSDEPGFLRFLEERLTAEQAR